MENENGKNQNVKLLKDSRVAKLLKNKDSKWTVLQEILQEIAATHIIENPNVKPKMTEMRKELTSEVKLRYKEDIEAKEALLDAIPTVRAMRKWAKREGWDEAVWTHIRGTGLFSHDKRAEMIQALFDRGVDKSDTAAKLWLTLSGDYTDKVEVTDTIVEKYREVNKILHRKTDD